MIVIVAFIGFLISTFFLLYKRSRHLPPGPLRFPIIGSLPYFEVNMHLTMCKWQKQYGDTFSYGMGNKLTVVLNNSDTIRKVLADGNTAGRDPDIPGLDSIRKNNQLYGLTFGQHELWKEHRRFTLSALRDFGMGKTWLEDSILEEVEEVCRVLTDHAKKPYDPKELLTHGVGNVISALAFGKRFEHSDERFTRLSFLLLEVIQKLADVQILGILPFLKYLPCQIRRTFKRLNEAEQEVVEFLENMIDEHKHRDTNGEESKDYIDKYLAESKLRGEGNTFTDFQLTATLFDLYGAGTETTATTLAWAFIFLLENPEILKKVQEEVSNNVAPREPIRMSDRVSLPYTEAVILEVQRLASLTPLSLPHQTFSDMMVDGYLIPKGTLIVNNIYFAHRDPRYWRHPDKFDPSRFLDSQGKVIRPDAFMPFSTGKRACVGESLAKMEIWLFLANILHRFNLKEKPGQGVSRDNYDFGIILNPKPYEIIFESRQ